MLVNVTIEPPLALVELDRKDKRNALCVALRDELEATLDSIAEDDRVRVVVLWGGPDFFCAGYDLDEMIATELVSLVHRGVSYTERTCFFSKPMVTAVAGFALAGGFDLAMGGDVVVAAEGTVLGRPEVSWGINPLLGRLSMRIGMTRALQVSMRGDRWTAEEALAAGIVDRVVPKADVLTAAREEAERIAKAPLETLVALKRAACTVPFLGVRDAIGFEFAESAHLMRGAALRGQLRAYTERTLKK